MAEEWIGITEEAFRPYRTWKTPSGYLCGTYATAVLFAFYQDYKGWQIIPETLREVNQTKNQQLVSILKRNIQPLGLPTIAPQVAHGWNRYFKQVGWNSRGRTTMIGGWQRIKKRIDRGQPLLVGLNRLLGSTYGNHWVVAYAYRIDSSGKKWLKIHDNWGNYRAEIPASWVNGTISLP